MPLPTSFVSRITQPSAHRGKIVLRRAEEALDEAAVSNISSEQVFRMTRQELARVVRAAPTPPARVRLDYLDYDTLRRLAHQARLSCRHRMS